MPRPRPRSLPSRLSTLLSRGVEDELVGLGGGGVVELGDVLGVLGLHDRDGLVIAEFDDPAAAKAYELILNTSKAIRSILSQYDVKTQGDIIILVARAAGKTLPQVLGDERHDGVDQGQGTLESSVERGSRAT
jgi:hypothetical protein